MPLVDPDSPAQYMTIREHIATHIAASAVVRPPQFFIGQDVTKEELARWAKDVWRVTDALLRNA